ncbi:LuxR C-terminal-related transcriptional regulator [Marinobacter sp. JSM 1782161]|uniref:LuxR C-terminal-related transcriptional regulator n=1 Tax=Marinobacter sp. JSM 1782161 TaxID=2685906 RepID=UPI0014037B9C|nr:LuxR C-terminal-related transcriptional regulator [Marinobacter sp. JSM 1782161]
MKSIQDVPAANDDFAGQARAVPPGDLIWDLLSHRIRMPVAPDRCIARPALQARVAAAVAPGRVLLVEAPAGFGKTQAVRAALAEAFESAAWVSLESRDNDPARLLALLALALGQDQRLDRTAFHEGDFPDRLSYLCQLYAKQRRQSPASVPDCVVLDNVHWLSHPAALDMVEQLVAELPEGLSLALLSREQVPFSTHASTLNGQMVRLGMDALSLSLPETLTLYDAELAAGRVSKAAVEHLHHLSEGWLTPLQLYRLELDDDGPTPRTILESPAVARFFKDGLMARFTLEAQTLLFQMAEPELVSDALFDAVKDGPGELDLLPSVACQKGLPVWPVAGKARWYRFNPLFRDWLLGKELCGRSGRAVRASRWFEARGDLCEALTHALRGQDADRALDIAASGSEALLVGQDTGALLNWRRYLPMHLVEKSPRLRLVYGWVHAIGGQFAHAEKLIGALDPEDRAALRGRLATLQGFILRGRGVIEPALDAVYEAVADPELSDHARMMALWIRSSALCADQRYTEARDANREAARLARESGDAGCEILAVYDHARIELGRGHIKRAETLIRRGIDVALSVPYQPPRVGESRLQLSLALVLWHQGRFDEAEACLVRSARQAEQCRDLGVLLNMGLRALIAKARGELEQAFGWIGQAERTMQLWQVDDVVYRPVLDALQVSCWLHTDQCDHIGELLERRDAQGDAPLVPELFPMLPGLLETLRIRHDIAASRLEVAQAKLDRYQQAGRETERPLGHLIYGKILQSLIHDRAGKPDRALVSLREALQEAAPEDYISPFVEVERPLRELLPKVLASSGDSPFHDALRGYFRVEKRPNAGSGEELQEPISERERGVLELIAIGLSNQDIADRLHISLHTVKTHARRINAKLGVRSRTQAIVRARELGVL